MSGSGAAGAGGGAAGRDPAAGGVRRVVGVRRGVAALVASEAVLLLAAACYLAVETVLAAPDRPLAVLTLAVITAAVGAGLVAVARGVAAGRRWARSPVLVWQALQAAAAFTATLPGGWGLGAPLLAVAAVTAVGVLLPGVIDPGDRTG